MRRAISTTHNSSTVMTKAKELIPLREFICQAACRNLARDKGLPGSAGQNVQQFGLLGTGTNRFSTQKSPFYQKV